jgi:integrase
VLRNRLEELREVHGVKTIKHGARHSFASYWLAQNGDINQLCRFLGHDDPETTFRHYAKAATKREAAKFFAILSKKPRKIARKPSMTDTPTGQRMSRPSLLRARKSRPNTKS